MSCFLDTPLLLGRWISSVPSDRVQLHPRLFHVYVTITVVGMWPEGYMKVEDDKWESSLLSRKLRLKQRYHQPVTTLRVEKAPSTEFWVENYIPTAREIKVMSCVSTLNPLTAKLFDLNFHPLEVVSRWRDPQLQVSENYSDLTKWRSSVFKYCWLM